MSQFAVNDAGELVRSGAAFTRVSDVPEIRQHVRVRLRLFRGECPLNTRLGMRYVGFILAKGTPPQLIAGEFVTAALQTPGIVSVSDVETSVSSSRVGTITYRAVASSADGARRIPLHDTLNVTLGGG